MHGDVSPELKRFREMGCNRIGPGISPEVAEGISSAFAEQRTCSKGHKYRGAFCVKCEYERSGWKAQA